jgi:hypothetical protein
MEIEKFKQNRDFLYHLTDRRNWEIIKKDRILLSANIIVNKSDLSVEQKHSILDNRRSEHTKVSINNLDYFIRDQNPISLTNLKKCLTAGWTVSDFLNLLNGRVFFWPTIKRLNSHYSRYKNENPLIIKVETSSMIEVNNHAEFCRLNSGATRSNSYLNGAPPQRGEGTFLQAHLYQGSIGSVAEVTFQNQCVLPNKVYLGSCPDGPWTEFNF